MSITTDTDGNVPPAQVDAVQAAFDAADSKRDEAQIELLNAGRNLVAHLVADRNVDWDNVLYVATVLAPVARSIVDEL